MFILTEQRKRGWRLFGGFSWIDNCPLIKMRSNCRFSPFAFLTFLLSPDTKLPQSNISVHSAGALHRCTVSFLRSAPGSCCRGRPVHLGRGQYPTRTTEKAHGGVRRRKNGTLSRRGDVQAWGQQSEGQKRKLELRKHYKGICVPN